MSIALMSATACPFYVGMGFYTKDTSFDPAQAWPGTKWQKLEGVFILAAGNGHAVGETGGEETHVLTIAEMPSHRHIEQQGDASEPNQIVNRLRRINGNGANNGAYTYANWKATGLGDYVYTDYDGDSQPHNNMPPYAVRIYWERTE